MPQAKQKLKVLFLCTGNSCRSQMAEAWSHALKVDELEAHSAGTSPQVLNPFAVAVMAECGVDISNHNCKGLDEVAGIAFDIVVTVCDSAKAACPNYTESTRVVHVGFDDPPALALGMADQKVVYAIYRRVRDEIKQFIEGLPDSINCPNRSN